MKKKAAVILSVILLIAVYALIAVNAEYKLEISDVKYGAVDFINRGEAPQSYKASESYSWFNTIGLGSKCFAMFEITNPSGELMLCEVELKEGNNGKYKIDSVRYGDGNFRERIVDQDGKKYFLLGGRNTALLIAKVSVEIEGESYILDIPNKERFFVYTEINPKTSENHILPDKITFLNNAGEDISGLINWN